MKHIVLLALFSLLLFPVKTLAAETWAIYWYVCGSDLETRGGCATIDINELMETVLPDNVTVVIQTGGSKQWQNDMIDHSRIERYVYKGNRLEQVEAIPQANMGDESTLASFLIFCNQNYSADRQVFVFWDHGGGSIGGVANDENFGGDALSLMEIRRAFDRAHLSSPDNPPFEIIGFDTCLMATLDTANALSGFARYMVASQDLEPGNGWNYSGWVGALADRPEMPPLELGKIICDTYLQGCRSMGTEGNATLSLIDLSKLPVLNMAYNALGLEAVVAAVEDPRFYSVLGRQAKKAENYVNSRTEGFTNMVDLGSLIGNLESSLPEFTRVTLDALDEAVVYQVNGPYRNPSGLSCYYPYDGDSSNYQTMLKTGNITSFLILNGLQHGFMDGDTAFSHLERISGEIDTAMAAGYEDEEVSSEPELAQSDIFPEEPEDSAPPAPETEGADETEATEETTQATPAAIAGFFNTHTTPGGGSVADAVNMLPASNIVLEAVAPLPELDISELEDFAVSITPDGSALLDLGPERIDFIDSVSFCLALYSVEDDIIMLLGKDADLNADWENGRFTDNFRGVWPALDGHYVYMEITYQGDDVNHYSVPIKLNGELCNLIVVYDFNKEAYQVIGARRILDNNVIDKAMMKLKPGDKVTTIMRAMTISGDDDEFQDVEIDEFTLGETIFFEDMDMGDGTFMFMFEMSDVQNNTATSQLVNIEVSEGEIYFGNI